MRWTGGTCPHNIGILRHSGYQHAENYVISSNPAGVQNICSWKKVEQ